MSATTADDNTTRWKRLVVRSSVGGAAFGLVLVLALLAFYLYEERPRGWDTSALRTVQAKAEPIDRLNEKFEEVSTGICFTVDVENTTRMDVSLPQTLTVMGETRNSHALHASFLKLSRDYFIPAQHVETITLDADQLCAAHYDSQICFDSYFKDDEEIVVFDNQNRYELRIVVPRLTLPSKGSEPPMTTPK